MLVLPHYGDHDTVGGDVATWIIPQHGDLEKAGVMKLVLMLSSLLGNPGKGYTSFVRCLLKIPPSKLHPSTR